MIQNDCYISLRKTTIVDVNEKAHHLPPDGGPFKEFKVADFFCPDEWIKDGIFVEVQEGQPMWFDLTQNVVCACLVSIQRLNPVTGDPANLDAGLTKEPTQNYVVLPRQLWLDGYAKDGKVYQFITTKAGEGLAVNEFALPKHMQDSHALAFAFFQPKNPPRRESFRHRGEEFTSGKISSLMSFSPLHTSKSSGDWFAGSTRGLDSISPDLNSAKIDTISSSPCDSSGKVICSTAGGAKTASINYNEVLDTGEAAAEPETVDILEDHKTFDKASMGMGGRIKQRIETDNNTVDYYQKEPSAILTIYLALPEQFEAIMKKGKRQDESKKDKFVHSGKVGKVQVPLVTKKDLGH